MFGMTGRLEPKMKSGSRRMILEWLNLYVMSSLWDSKDGFHVLAGGFKRSSYSFIFTLEEMTQFYCIFFQMRGSATNSCSFVQITHVLGFHHLEPDHIQWTLENMFPPQKVGQDLCVRRFVVMWARHDVLLRCLCILIYIYIILCVYS